MGVRLHALPGYVATIWTANGNVLTIAYAVFAIARRCCLQPARLRLWYLRLTGMPVSNQGITSYIIPDANPGGNWSCAEVGKAYFR
jgi:hypothetical protein